MLMNNIKREQVSRSSPRQHEENRSKIESLLSRAKRTELTVNVIQEDGGALSSQLQRRSLQIAVTCSLHDQLSHLLTQMRYDVCSVKCETG